ncbi:hypothetical protein SASPL_155561 [Salvia splendens]|uniref:Uncharacterized protein n=1 Tax=Salvia splendens TaxID=180675 RepID=A0A8X8YY55_SALSN|nr:hypothetical protein SASPL_155561 [Salvia splendens]
MYNFSLDIFVVSSHPASLFSTLNVEIIPGDSLSSNLKHKQEQFDNKFQSCFDMSNEVSIMKDPLLP